MPINFAPLASTGEAVPFGNPVCQHNLDELASPQFSFVHMNTGVIEAEAASLNFVLNRMASSGILLIDAYGAKGTDADSYSKLHEADRTLLYFLSGQAALFKR